MISTLRMPQMGETMEEGRLVAWLVEPGQPFKRGDVLLEVETDKTLVEFPALGDGTLVERLVELGTMVVVGAPIARIDVGEGPDWTADGNAPEPEPEAAPMAAPEPTPELSTPLVASAASQSDALNKKVRATPLARRIAQQQGIDLSRVKGTGRRSRIERRDVLAAAEHASESLPSGLHTGHGLAWLEKGDAAGVPILFVHGFAADHSAWAGLQSNMARSGSRTVAVDLPSHGEATLDARDVDDLAPPLSALAENRLGWVSMHIVAHSMGAIAAVALARARPVTSLTLIAPVGVGRRINTAFLDTLAQPRSLNQVKTALKQLTAGPNGLSEAAIEGIFQNLAQGRVVPLARSLAGASGQAVDLRADIAALAEEIPVSIILGHRDQIVDWSEALDVSPLIAVHHFAEAGHMPHWEALSEVQAIIERKVRS